MGTVSMLEARGEIGREPYIPTLGISHILLLTCRGFLELLLDSGGLSKV